MSAPVGSDALDVADALSVAVATRNIEAVARIYHPDLIVWHSYDNAEQTRDENLVSLGAFLRDAVEVRYDDIRRQRTDSGFVQQHTLVAVLSGGQTLEPRPVCLVAEVRDGRILRLDEYIPARRVSAS
ncbi:MAG: ketosteroid isomerase [Proteobacteria bacterium]|nr:ketosteroid isomerase [Pseudomonadota bacterium]